MNSQEEIDRHFMEMALEQAHQSYLLGEVPIGAVVVHDGQVVGAGHNMRERFEDATYHAEMLAIEEACSHLRSWRLLDCDLYVTLEPCIMCCGAIINSRIDRVCYGAPNPKAGAADSLYHLLQDSRLNHQAEVVSGALADQCGKVMKDFFRAARRRHKAVKRRQKAARQKGLSDDD